MSKSKKKLNQAAKAAIANASPAQLAEAGISTAPLAAAPTTETPKVKTSRAHRPAGLGHPEAKKLINPQHTLEMKKAAAAKIGGTMVWTNKNWKVSVPAGEFTIASREMAGLSLATFLEKVGSPPPPAPKADPVPDENHEAEALATA